MRTPSGHSRVRTIVGAARFVDAVGLALLFPDERCVLPTLWRAIAGPGPVVWATEDEHGRKQFTNEMSLAWDWKEQLASKRLCCAGKHLRGRQALVSFAVLPALYALTGRPGAPDDYRLPGVLSPLEIEIADAVLDADRPQSAPQIRRSIGTRDTAKVNRAIDRLQRMLVLTKAGAAEQRQGWPAGTVDLVARRHAGHLRHLPRPDEANRSIARTVLGAVGELSGPDLAAALGWSRAEAGATLRRLADEGGASASREGGVDVYRPTT